MLSSGFSLPLYRVFIYSLHYLPCQQAVHRHLSASYIGSHTTSLANVPPKVVEMPITTRQENKIIPFDFKGEINAN